MRKRMWINVLGIALALAGSSASAPARAAQHHRRISSGHTVRRHGGIIGNRRSRVYYLRRTGSGLPARANRVYFGSVADARAAGYQRARQAVIPIDPRLTWRNARGLPSLGKHHEPPPPKWMRKPTVPPGAEQPEVTPTQPMPN